MIIVSEIEDVKNMQLVYPNQKSTYKYSREMVWAPCFGRQMVGKISVKKSGQSHGRALLALVAAVYV